MRLAPNGRHRSRRNVHSHYDLGNDFFEHFLDPTLTYSCGVFEREDSSLEEASIAKYDRLCRKLSLQASDHVLEIGTGWGGFALHAARHYGCRVTTTTLSDRQLEVARDRVRRAGLDDLVTVLHEDYRDLRGRFDKLVSIEMVEAVGRDYLGTYLGACAERLEPHGAMALQAITIDDRHYERAARTVDFIKRYVFPGGFLPSVTAIADAATRCSDLRVSHLEELTPHYAETLRRWRARFLTNRRKIRALGYGEELLRMWEFYLAYCEGGFEERHIGLVQMVLTKPGPDAAPACAALGGAG
jgi:cyclopropane-fatty-acyl-phospholipid synthase